MKKTYYIIFIFLASFLLYANTLNHDFVYDDIILVEGNTFVQKGISGIPEIFKNDSFQGYFQKNSSELVQGGRYRPFTIMMFAIEWELFGNNPFAFHLVQVLCYALLSCFVFLLLCRLLSLENKKQLSFVFPFAATLFFAFHPIHTEVVANVKSRDEIMALVFALISWYIYLKSDAKLKLSNVLLIFFFFLLALLSKESALAFMIIIPFSGLLFRGLNFKEAIVSSSPILIAFGLYLIIRYSVIGFDFQSGSNDLFNNPFLKYEAGKLVDFSFFEKTAGVLLALGLYVKLLIFPHPLTHDYYPRHIELLDFSSPSVWLSLFVYIALFYCLFKSYKKNKWFSLSLIIFFSSLLLVSNIIFNIGAPFAERFAFIPSLGYAIILSYILNHLLAKYSNDYLKYGIVLIILTLFAYKTINRNRVWKDNFTLITTDVKTSKNSAKLLYEAAQEISLRAYKINDLNEKVEQLRIADDYLNDALRIHPLIRKANMMLGNNRFVLNRYDAAIPYYEKELLVSPRLADVKQNLLVSYRELGRVKGERDFLFEEAEELYIKAYKINPKDYETVRLLAMTMVLQAKFQQSIQYFNESIELDPYVPMAYVTLGKVYREIGDEENAQINFDKALAIDPNFINEIEK